MDKGCRNIPHLDLAVLRGPQSTPFLLVLCDGRPRQLPKRVAFYEQLSAMEAASGLELSCPAEAGRLT